MATGISLSFLSMFGTMLIAGGLSGLPLGIPPAEPDPAMARVAPEECLFYLSWSGMADASPDSSNHAERLLAEPEVQRFIKEVTDRLNAALKQGAGEGANARKVAEITPRILMQIAVNPTAVFAGKFNAGPTATTVPVGVVVNLGDAAGAFEKDLLAVLEILTEQPVPRPVNGVRTLVTPPGVPKIQWKIEGGYFILGVSDGTIAEIQERMAGKAVPNWLAEIRDRLPVDRVSSVTFINTKEILASAAPFLMMAGPETGNVVRALGLSNLESVVNVTGMTDSGIASRTWLHIEGKPTGLFAMLGAEPIQAADLAVVPADATIALTAKLDASRLFEQFLSLVDTIEPRSAGRARQELAGLTEEIGFSLENDLIGSLGDTWNVYQSPSEGGPLFTNWTGVVSVKNPARLRAVSQTIVKNVRNFELQMMARQGRRPRTVGVRTMTVGGHSIHFMNSIGEEIPFAPAWCVTDTHLVVSLFPQGIAAFLNREPGTDNLSSLPHIQRVLKADVPPTKLVHVDSARVCRMTYPLVLMGANILFSELQREGVDLNISVMPDGESLARHLQPATTTVTTHDDGIEVVSTRTLPISIGVGSSSLPMLFFAGVSNSRMTRFGQPSSPGLLDVLSPKRAQRTMATNNLKQIGLAMHNFHDSHNRFPAAVIRDEDGKSLLSWRVQLLPFLEEAPLFQEFHMDEPWDSPHNKALISRMPKSLLAPGSKAGAGKTNYVGLRHAKGIFHDGEGTRMRDILDGTSNTIMAVEVNDEHAVIWTKPDDLDFNEKKPHTGLVGLRTGGFLAAFCDGAVSFIPETITAETLVRLVLRNDGQPVDFNRIQGGDVRVIRGVARDVPDLFAPDAEEVQEAVPDLPKIVIPQQSLPPLNEPPAKPAPPRRDAPSSKRSRQQSP
jgi:hypothetical protein